MMHRPVLLGMNNPQGNEAFDPTIPNTSGWRIFKMLQMRVPKASHELYLRVFDRRNLIEGIEWHPFEAQRIAQETKLWESLTDRDVIVFGDAVRQALDLPIVQKVVLCEHKGVKWRFLPHPSGRAQWYNEQLSREMAALVLEEMFHRGRRLLD